MMDLSKIKQSKSTVELIKFGIINIDKPTGPTSFSVSHYVMKHLSLSKTSHLGTLDPMVTGVLPVALSRACRLNEYLMHRDKTYVGIMRLHKEVSQAELNKTIDKFIGKISQLPPLRSRVKRALREREIKSFKILEIDGKDILFETQVQAGTYIRKLCDDMGKEIGGAHMLELRRTKAGTFDEKEIFTMYDFDQAVGKYKNGDDSQLRNMIVPGEIVATLLPIVHIHKQVLKKCLTGSPIFPSFLTDEKEIKDIQRGDKICIYCASVFVGCYNFIGADTLTAKPEFILN